MTQNTTAKGDTKRSRWKFFPKDRRKSPGAAEAKKNEGTTPTTDSAYGGSGTNSAQTSENEGSSQQSLRVPKNQSGRTSTTPPALSADNSPQKGQPSGNNLLSPDDARPHNHERVPSNGDMTVTTPTIRKETHHDPATGTAVTTITTTTTTTTTVAGPNGTTVIEEPRAELGDGQRTPEATSPSEAVAAAIHGQGDGHLHNRFGNEETRPATGQWNPITPGGRSIPQRGNNGSMTDLRQSNGYEEHPISRPVSSIPDRNSSIYPQQQPNGPYAAQNQSRWSQIPPQLRPNVPPQQEPTSTLGNLKMAAAGLHGAGETLRGTISQTADRRLPVGKPSTAKMSKHEEMINKGKYEMEHLRFAPRDNGMAAGQGLQSSQSSQVPVSGQPQSDIVPTPDGHPTHVELSRKPFSTRYDVQPLSPEEDQPPAKRGFGRWLPKRKSHPSDDRQKMNMKEDNRSFEGTNGKLQRRSKVGLGPVVE